MSTTGKVKTAAEYGARAAGARATQTREQYGTMLRDFSPMDYLNRAAESAFSGIKEDYTRIGDQAREGANARGFVYAGAGSGSRMRDLNDRIARTMGGLSMQAGQMEQDRIGAIGQMGRDDFGQSMSYYDLLGGAMDRETAAKNAKRSRWSNLAGGLGALAGGLIGGPAGAGVGHALGQGIGGMF